MNLNNNNNQTMMSVVIGAVALIIGILIGTFLIGSSDSTTTESVGLGVPGAINDEPTQIDVVWYSNLTGIVQSVDSQQVTIAIESADTQSNAAQPLITLPIQFHPNNTSPVNEYRQDNATGTVDALPSSIENISPGNRVSLNIKRETTGTLAVDQITLYTSVN